MLAVLLALCIHCSGSMAAVQPLRVNPSRVIYEEAPGAVITGSVTVTNTGVEDAVLEAALYDWELDADKQLVVRLSSSLPSSLEGWVKFNPRQFSLSPGKSQIVRYTIRVPGDAVGEHRGMIAFEQTLPPDALATGAVAKVQVTTTVYVGVNPVIRQARPVGGVVETSDQATRVSITMESVGNAHYRGTASFTIVNNANEQVVAEGDLEPLVIMPGSTLNVYGETDTVLAPGSYTLELLILSDEPGVPPLLKVYEFTV